MAAYAARVLDDLLDAREEERDEQRCQGDDGVKYGSLRYHSHACAKEKEKVGRLAKLLKEKPIGAFSMRV